MLDFGLWLIFSCLAASTTGIKHVSCPGLVNQEALNESISGFSAIEACHTLRENARAREEISYQKVPIPSASEVAELISHLHSAETEEEDCEDAVSEEVLDFTMRFAALSYGRNSGELAQFTILAGEGNVAEAIEIQFQGTSDRANGAHAVVYLYKAIDGGAGVVLSFKGSTLNLANWSHNLQWTSEYLLSADARSQKHQPECEAAVHRGFLKYKRTLDARMKHFSLWTTTGIHDVLKKWGASPARGITLYDWLRQGKWKWCLVVGHSLGGAMAQIAAAELSLYSGKLPFLATIGSPTTGNAKFADTLEAVVNPAEESTCPKTRVLPGGGLRFYNAGDWVPSMGYLGVGGKHAGYAVEMEGRSMEWISKYHIHLCYTFPSRMLDGTERTLTLTFPGVSYNPQGFADKPTENSKLKVISSHKMAETG